MKRGDVVVVVGTGPGLGIAIARAFSEAGGRVVAIARNADRLTSLTRTVDGVIALPADACDEAALRRAFATVRDKVGDPAVLVHNPSIAFEAAATGTPLSALMDGFTLAAGSLLVSAQEVVPAMRRVRTGFILATGSSAALTGSTWSASLAAQKAAARNLTLSLATELADDGIRVGTIVIDGILGTPGFECDRIAAEYVRAATQDNVPWRPEINWPA